MRVLDEGHRYELRMLDDPMGEAFQTLKFVKREGPGYPGNVGHYAGTTTQEVIRALIERAKYVDGQIHDPANVLVIRNLREAIWHLEERAARRHGRPWTLPLGFEGIENLPTCEKCNHIGCEGDCH